MSMRNILYRNCTFFSGFFYSAVTETKQADMAAENATAAITSWCNSAIPSLHLNRNWKRQTLHNPSFWPILLVRDSDAILTQDYASSASWKGLFSFQHLWPWKHFHRIFTVEFHTKSVELYVNCWNPTSKSLQF